MKKRAADLTFEELAGLSAAAGAKAVQEALAGGVPVMGVIDGRRGISTIHPDGSITPLVAQVSDGRKRPTRRPRKSRSAA